MASSSFEFLDFSNTEIAFKNRSDKELKEVHRLFRLMNSSSLVALGSRLTPLAFKLHLPFFKTILKATIFKQFVGGESLLDTQSVIDQLHRLDTLTILDYGAEAKTSEDELDAVVKETMSALELAASNSSVPVVVSKVTGLADNQLLIKMQEGGLLSPEEESQKEKLISRLDQICKRAFDLNVSIMIDAEESWLQESIDQLTDDMMASYNRKSVIVFNTYQLYRHDKLEDLKKSYDKARSQNYLLGAKLVRGAYMDKENIYAKENNIPTLINASKEDTDMEYNKAISFCVENYENVSSVCASHNAKSNKLMAHLIEKNGVAKTHPHLNFCQLYGMSDNLTFNLSKAGYNVAKYVPYGPIRDVIPYLIRRAKENSAVTSDMSRELSFIEKELKRRGLK